MKRDLKLKITYKKTYNAKTPEYDSGLVLFSTKKYAITSGSSETISSGIMLDLPENFNIIYKNITDLLNTPLFIKDVIINDKNEIQVIMGNYGDRPITINIGDKIAKILIVPVTKIDLIEAKNIDEKQDTE